MQLRTMFLGTRRFEKVAMLLAAGVVGLWSANAHADLTEVIGYGNAGGADGVAELTTVDAALGNYNLKANGTDFWGGADHGAFAYDPIPVEGDFSAIVRSVSIGAGETLAGEWGRTGIMARADGAAANSPNVAMIRKSGGSGYGFVLQGRDSFGGGTGRPGGEFGGTEANNEPVDSTPVWLALSRKDDVFFAQWADDVAGAPGTWSNSLARAVSPDLMGGLVVGLAHQSHNIHPVANTAIFEGFEVGALNGDLDFSLPPAIDTSFILAGAPTGGVGTIGIREIINNGSTSNQDLTRASIASGAGTIIDYQASVLNIQDSGGSGNYGGDANFAVVDSGDVAKGSVDNIAMLAQGTIRITEAGTYTFGVNSDDGFAFYFPGRDFNVSTLGGVNFEDGKGFGFFGGRGVANTLAQIDLPAGDHKFVMTYAEGGGGSAVELFAAKGAQDSFNSEFNLVGAPAPGPVNQIGTAGDVFVSVVKRNDGGELTTIAGGRELLDSPGLNEVYVGTVPYVSVGDPESGGRDFSFPGLDNGIDDNDFVSKFTGFIEVPADGVYQFRTNTDDNAELIIGGADFTLVSSGNEGATTVAGDTATADFLTGNTNMVVETFLTEGTHPFEFIQVERGGGANASLMVMGAGGFEPLGMTAAGVVQGEAGLELVPEPSTFVLAGLGVLGLAFVGYRRRRNG